jgi:anaerobic magnesium-protoporphyrin IX monomethyl ester cyclase
MKVLFVEPPRRLWPYVNFDDNYLTKQSYLALAAYLRTHGIRDVHVLDCMPLKIGWKRLARELRALRPDVVAVGENHALYAGEAERALDLARQVLPGVVTVAGGAHFSHLSDAYLGGSGGARSSSFPDWVGRAEPVADFVVKGEGEQTLLELLEHVAGGSRLPSDVAGLAYRDGSTVVHTPVRDLVEDLDSLPMPAYDLVPMELYGSSRLLFSPGGTTIAHSRGCAHNCRFCVWWTQMASRRIAEDGSERLAPRWRTQSPERSVDEAQLLVSRYGKRGLVYVDDCWNLDPRWSDAFAEEVLRRNLQFNWFAFMRADYLLRDHENGVLRKLVRAGLRHVSIGAERVEAAQLESFGKRNYSADTTRRAFDVLRVHYPQVFRQATFIVGVPDETRESMWEQWRFAKELRLDYPGFHPLTPVPGTRLWDEAVERGELEATSFDSFDWATPVVSSSHLSRRDIEANLIEMERRYVTPSWLASGLASRYPYKRAMYQWFAKVSLRMGMDVAWRLLTRDDGPLVPLVEPPWYHS